ncbi:hypothetical protein L7F22_030697 [Adiantum nelumboides]|nr:hypothetical protein [Adiantum nelumboides]
MQERVEACTKQAGVTVLIRMHGVVLGKRERKRERERFIWEEGRGGSRDAGMVCQLHSRAVAAMALTLCITALVLALLVLVKLTTQPSAAGAAATGTAPKPAAEDHSCKQEKQGEKVAANLAAAKRRQLRGALAAGGRYNYCVDERQCGGGKACCGGRCVDVCGDASNCGSCGRVCPFMLGCCQGRCLDLASDPLNCGQCGHFCPDPHYCNFGLCNYY